MELTLNERRIIFNILVLIMRADFIIKDEEVKFLDKIFEDFKLSIDEFDHLDNLDFDYLRAQFANLDNEKKKYAKSLFDGMAACDGFIDPREYEIINKL